MKADAPLTNVRSHAIASVHDKVPYLAHGLFWRKHARTLRKAAAPCEMMQSRSISPKRRPPSRARPSTGCRVRICTGPRPRL